MYIFPKPKEADETHAGVICAWHNSFSNEEIERIISEVESLIELPNSKIRFDRALTIGDEMDGVSRNDHDYQGKRTNYQLNLTDNAKHSEALRQANNQFYTNLFASVDWYRKRFGIEEEIHFKEPFNLLRYQYGQHYEAHYDGTTVSGRTVSAILYLNDNYSGGELEFPTYDLKIKPKAGTLYVFPSNYPYRHIAHPVTEGTKYAIVTWLHDR